MAKMQAKPKIKSKAKKTTKKATRKQKKKAAKKTLKKTAKKKASKKVTQKKIAKKTPKRRVKKTAKNTVKETTKSIFTKPVEKRTVKRKFKTLPKKELKEFKRILFELKDQISSEIDHINKEARSNLKDVSGDLSSHSLHMADIADESFSKELNLELASHEREILMAIDQALHRIGTSEYGQCFDCECSIPKSRLRVIPYTLLCKKCQEEREKNMVRF